MGALSRRKGAAWEREVVHKLREAMPGADVRRGLQSQGEVVADVDCPVWWVECKRGRRPVMRAALHQAEEAAPNGRMPLAIIRDDGDTRAYAVLRLDDLLELVEEWWNLRMR